MDKDDKFQLILAGIVFAGIALTFIGVAVIEGDGGIPGYIEIAAGLGIAGLAFPADWFWRTRSDKEVNGMTKKITFTKANKKVEFTIVETGGFWSVLHDGKPYIKAVFPNYEMAKQALIMHLK